MEREPDRRRHSRIQTRLVVFVKYANGKVERALTQDIGGMGACLVTSQPLAPGTVIGVEIKLPDREALVAGTATVVWSRQLPDGKGRAETGITFTSIDPKELAILQQYVKLNSV